MLRMAELCAGYGGLHLAAKAAGWPVELVWYAENDVDACKVLAAHHPNAPNVGDITAAQFSACPPVDVLAAGFPCTTVSYAGQRRGSNDERWLWPDVTRAVRMLRPPVFVGENVPGLLTIERGRLFGQVLADLDDLGYTVRWTTVGACRVGLCHHRHRVFIVASLAGLAEPARWPVARRAGRAGTVAGRSPGWEVAGDTLFGAGLPPQWPVAGVVSGGTVWAEPVVTCGADGIVLPTPVASTYGSNRLPTPGAAVRPSLEGVVRMLPTPGARLGDGRGAPDADLAAARLDSGRRNLDDAVALLPTPMAGDWGTAGRRSGDGWRPNLSEALLPTPTARDGMSGPGHAESAAERARSADRAHPVPTPRARDPKGRDPNPRGVDLNEAIAQLLPTPRASDGEKGGPNQRGSSGDLALPAAVQPGRFGPYEAAARRHELVTGVPAPEPTEPGAKGQPRLAPALPEWMLSLPPGWVTDHLPRRAALRVIGNGIATLGGAYALRLLTDGLLITGEQLEVA